MECVLRGKSSVKNNRIFFLLLLLRHDSDNF